MVIQHIENIFGIIIQLFHYQLMLAGITILGGIGIPGIQATGIIPQVSAIIQHIGIPAIIMGGGIRILIIMVATTAIIRTIITTNTDLTMDTEPGIIQD